MLTQSFQLSFTVSVASQPQGPHAAPSAFLNKPVRMHRSGSALQVAHTATVESSASGEVSLEPWGTEHGEPQGVWSQPPRAGLASEAHVVSVCVSISVSPLSSYPRRDHL